MQRIARAMQDDIRRGPYPKLHRVPVVLTNWDFTRGILRIGFSRRAELEVHICYLRIADLQMTFAQMLTAAGQGRIDNDKALQALGAVMAGLDLSPRMIDS